MRWLSAVSCILLIGIAVAQDEKHGFWWYHDPVKHEQKKTDHARPPLPADEAMMQMHPKELSQLLEAHREYAVYKLTPEAVRDYYKVQDVVRRKAAAFTALTEVALLQNPELNARAAYPVTNYGRAEKYRREDYLIKAKLSNARDHFALGFLVKKSCPYCHAMRPTVQFFSEKYGWRVKEIDIKENPAFAERFNVQITPTLIVIEKSSKRWMPIAVGVEPLPKLEATAYRAIRLLQGEITAQQFYTDEDAMQGFFDPMRGGHEVH